MNAIQMSWVLGGRLASGAMVMTLAATLLAGSPARAQSASTSDANAPTALSGGTTERIDELALVDSQTGPERPGNCSGLDALDEAVERRLLAPVHDMVFSDTPFSELMLDLRNVHQINLLLDQSAIDDSLDSDTSISIEGLGQVTVERALTEVLNSHNATFIIRGGIVKVISRDVAEDPEFFERRIFDCAELSAKLPRRLVDRLPKAPEAGIPAASPPAAAPESDMALGQVETPAPAPVPRAQRPDLTTLEELIVDSVDPDTWSKTGNGDAVIWELNGRLIVHAPGSTMRGVRDFLRELEANYLGNE